MNVSVFQTGSTNIFPLANDTKGGQLMTEFNLKSRESVLTNPEVPYLIGPSYVHGETDFNIESYTDAVGGIISTWTFRITPGRAVVDGHYLESLAPVIIDMTELNRLALQKGDTNLSTGTMAVGLRAMYSTEQTMAGALLPYNSESIYEGIQVVVLPVSEVRLPGDKEAGVQIAQDKVNMHLKLGEFQIVENSIVEGSFKLNPDRLKYIPSTRIQDFDTLIDDTYLTKTGLDPKRLYTFAGKGTDPNTGRDTWCDSTDALMVWDSNPTLGNIKPSVKEATFGVSGVSGKTQLIVPHKQVPDAKDTYGNAQYYKDKVLDLPLADFSMGTSGTVDRAYTNEVKKVTERINELYNLPAGRQVGYIPVLSEREPNPTSDEALPKLNNRWEYGDYIIVGEDNTVDNVGDSTRAPSTMYMVIPGIVSAIKYKATGSKNSSELPSSIKGRCIYQVDWTGDAAPNTQDTEEYEKYFDLDVGYHARTDGEYADYFAIKHTSNEQTSEFTMYYYVASAYADESKVYSDPIHLTAQIGLATEETVGGFYNVPETALDGGYVYRDETGHLRLLDYSLLRTGVLAYQLGEDFECPSGISSSEVQSNLDEYVNQRVAFANSNQVANYPDRFDVINVTIDLTAEETDNQTNIYDLDSRFGTCVYLHIKGTPGSNCTLNINNCQKLRIDVNIPADMTINVNNCCLYYDAGVLNRLNTIQNLSLWYQQYDEADPKLLVDGMSVRCIDEPIIPDGIDYWNESSPNDNHYAYALHSITFAPDGVIVGAGLYIKNETTANIADGKSIISAEFVLPQGSGLNYPKNRLSKQIKISGQFIQAYVTDKSYKTIDTKFTALTNTYNPNDGVINARGVIAMYTDVNTVKAISGMPAGTPLDCWEPNTFYVFTGVAL